MKIIEPHCEYWSQTNMYEHIANIASVCYHSPKKEGEKAKKMVEGLIKRKHISPTRHASMYFIVPWEELGAEWIENWENSPYIEITGMNNGFSDIVCISTNYNFLLDHPYLADVLSPYQVTPEEFMKECPELMRFTFCLTTQISTSRELNRKSPNNIMEESTRYILYAEDGKAEPAICRPWWLSKEDMDYWNLNSSNDKQDELVQYHLKNTLNKKNPYLNKVSNYLLGCLSAFNTYRDLLGFDMRQEDARGVLPLDTKTTVIYTYSVKEWSDIFKLRYLDMTGKAHPNCKVIMGLVLKEFNKLGYELTDKGDLIYRKKFNV